MLLTLGFLENTQSTRSIPTRTCSDFQFRVVSYYLFICHHNRGLGRGVDGGDDAGDHRPLSSAAPDRQETTARG